MADIFDVVSDPTRRDIMQALLDARGEISVGDLVERLGLSQPTVSKHLRVLRENELVSVREDGQHRYYRLEPAPLGVVEDWLEPFLAPHSDEEVPIDDGGSAVFAAWSGADVGESLGRRIADGQHQARTVIQDASEAVQRRLPTIMRKRLFRNR